MPDFRDIPDPNPFALPKEIVDDLIRQAHADGEVTNAVPSADFEFDPTPYMTGPRKTTVGDLRAAMAELGYTLPPTVLPDDAEITITDCVYHHGPSTTEGM